MEVKIQYSKIEKALANIQANAQNLETSSINGVSEIQHLSVLSHLEHLNKKLDKLLSSYQAVMLKNELAARNAVQSMKETDELLGAHFAHK